MNKTNTLTTSLKLILKIMSYYTHIIKTIEHIRK